MTKINYITSQNQDGYDSHLRCPIPDMGYEMLDILV